MQIEQRTGSAPGTIFVTISHESVVKTIPVFVMRTETGRFVAKYPDGRWTPECLTLDNAIMMSTTPLFPIAIERNDWLVSQQRVPIKKLDVQPLEFESLS